MLECVLGWMWKWSYSVWFTRIEDSWCVFLHLGEGGGVCKCFMYLSLRHKTRHTQLYKVHSNQTIRDTHRIRCMWGVVPHTLPTSRERKGDVGWERSIEWRVLVVSRCLETPERRRETQGGKKKLCLSWMGWTVRVTTGHLKIKELWWQQE